MSIIGTRPPLISETNLYELHHRIPFYPKAWKDSFGLSVEEHKKALETNLTDGYIMTRIL